MIKFGEDTIMMVLQQKKETTGGMNTPIVFCLGIEPVV